MRIYLIGEGTLLLPMQDAGVDVMNEGPYANIN